VTRLALVDWLVVAAYFALVFIIAAWATRRGRRGQTTATDSFLAGRHTGWFVVGASLFASNIGSEHVVGLAGTGAASGVAVAQFEVIASFCLLLLGWLFVPFYLRSGVFTMPEFLERRYSSGARWYLALVSIVAYVLAHISVTIAAGGIVFEALLGINFGLGAARLVAELNKASLSGPLLAYAEINFLHFAALLFVTCTAILVVASLTAPAPSAEKIAGLTFATAPADANADDRGRGRDLAFSVLLVACVVGIWVYFS
jgi:SSS family solute:Na+ symporter